MSKRASRDPDKPRDSDMPRDSDDSSSLLTAIDPRFKILHAVIFIVAYTFIDFTRLSPVWILAAILITAAILIGRAFMYRVSPVSIAKQSLIVLPFALGIALFAPLSQLSSWSVEAVVAAYRSGWALTLDIVVKAYVAAFLVSAVMRSMSLETFIDALARLRVPAIFIMLFTFLYRFTDLFRDEIRIMRDAARSRAPFLHGWKLLAFYGRMSGNLFVRAYERGEQIHAAMLSRGYDGTLPRPSTPERP